MPLKIFKTSASLRDFIETIKQKKQTIALVPTMGALHNGHISLINAARQEADVVICSVFVNPTQFTDPNDLKNYPRPVEHDIAMLELAGCDAVYMPSVQEIYPTWPKLENWHVDLGDAEFLLEGAFRKGHYQGVTQVVKKLFDAVTPDVALFGQKDFQQVLMIKNMVEGLRLAVKIISCPIIRETDGLAMSSRNVHLSSEDREHALVLYKALAYVRDNHTYKHLQELISDAVSMIKQAPGVELDYFTVANAESLLPADENDPQKIALVAAKVGATRLIDNVILNY